MFGTKRRLTAITAGALAAAAGAIMLAAPAASAATNNSTVWTACRTDLWNAYNNAGFAVYSADLNDLGTGMYMSEAPQIVGSLRTGSCDKVTSAHEKQVMSTAATLMENGLQADLAGDFATAGSAAQQASDMLAPLWHRLGPR